jgi:arginase
MSELGAGTRGASLGFEALRMASFKRKRNFFKKHSPDVIQDENALLYEDVNTPVAKRLSGIFKVYGRIETKIAEVIMEGEFPLVISGDHSNAGGTIAGLKRAFPDDRIGVIWVDAHADIHSPYTSPTGNVHGMPLSTALSLNNEECQVADVPEETAQLWDSLKGENPRIKPEDIVYIGVRDYEEPEEHLMKQLQLRNITVEEFRKLGMDASLQVVMERLKDCDRIYVSFDVDSMDPEISRGTGTPVPGGLWQEEAKKLLLQLAKDPRLCCLEITEINPVLDDKGNAMGEAAFDILHALTVQLDKRK